MNQNLKTIFEDWIMPFCFIVLALHFVREEGLAAKLIVTALFFAVYLVKDFLKMKV